MTNASERRRPFLGRDSELTALVGRAELALAGRGSIAVILGEPGSGKSRLMRELGTRLSKDSLNMFEGQCRAGDAAPPLFPWIEIAAQLEPDANGDVPPAIRQLLDTRDAPVNGGPQFAGELDLARTFEQYLAFLRSVSRFGPFFVLVEDLQWADQSSLRLLEYLSGSMVRLPIFIAVTSRDSDAPDLVRTLGYLQREPSTRRIVLGGLQASAIAGILELESGESPPASLVTAVAEATGGNPLFVSELARAIASGEIHLDRPGIQMPSSIRETIRARLAQFSPATLEVLIAAAVAGREFRPGTLSSVIPAGIDASAEVESLARAGLFQSSAAMFAANGFGQSHAFVHALVRDVIYANTPAARRREIHGRIADYLSTLPGAATPEGIAELAYHYARALPGGNPSAAVSAARGAGEFAIRGFDAAGARNHFAAALNALDLVPEREPERGELLFLLGDAQTRSGNVRGGKETLAQAIRLASASNDTTLLARAALSYGEFQEAGVADPNRLSFLETAINMLSRDDPYWVPAMALLAEAESMAGRAELALRHSEIALAAARETGEALPLVVALNGRLWAMRTSPDLDERTRLAEQMLVASIGLRNREHQVKAQRWRLLVALESGDRSHFTQEMEAYARDTAVLREPVLLWRSACHQVVHAFLRGDHHEAEKNYERAVIAGHDVNSRGTAVLMAVQRFALLKMLGRGAEMHEQLSKMAAAAPTSLTARIVAAAAAHAAGDFDAARAQVEAVWQMPRRTSMADSATIAMTVLLAEVAADVADEAVVAALVDELEPHIGRVAVLGDGMMTLGPVARVSAILRARLGHDQLSIAAFDQAMSLAGRLGAPAVMAGVLADYSEMLIAIDPDDPDPRVYEMLQQAGDIARRTGLATLQARIERLEAELGSNESA